MTTRHRVGALLATALMLLAAGAGAGAAEQKVFRCGPDGRLYSQTPCKDGYEVDAADKRSAEQRKAAEDAVKREEKWADKMTRERLAKEAAAAKQAPTIIIGSPAAAKPEASTASAAAKKHKKPVKPATQP